MHALGYSLDNLSLMALTLAIGFLVDDAIVFLENTVRRMERGEQPFEAAVQQRQRNQLHDHVDDDFTRGCVYSARVHDWTGWPNLPRVCHHDRHRDLRFGSGVADAHSVDVCATVKATRRRFEEDVDGARYRRHRETRARVLWRIALVVFEASLDLASDLGRLSWLERSGCSCWSRKRFCHPETAALSLVPLSRAKVRRQRRCVSYQNRVIQLCTRIQTSSLTSR